MNPFKCIPQCKTSRVVVMSSQTYSITFYSFPDSLTVNGGAVPPSSPPRFYRFDVFSPNEIVPIVWTEGQGNPFSYSAHVVLNATTSSTAVQFGSSEPKTVNVGETVQLGNGPFIRFELNSAYVLSMTWIPKPALRTANPAGRRFGNPENFQRLGKK